MLRSVLLQQLVLTTRFVGCVGRSYVVGTSALTAAAAAQQGLSTSRDAFLVKLVNGTNTAVWTQHMASTGDDVCEAVAFSPGNARQPHGIVAIGSFSASMTLGSGSYARTLSVPVNRFCGTYCYGTFIARYATNGRLLWAVAATGTLNDRGAAVVASSSAVWVTASVESDSLVFSKGGAMGGAVSTYPAIANGVLAKLDLDNGALLMGRMMAGYGTSDVMRDVVVVPEDSPRCAECIVVVGTFRGDATPPDYRLRSTILGWSSDAVTMTSRGAGDMYVALVRVPGPACCVPDCQLPASYILALHEVVGVTDPLIQWAIQVRLWLCVAVYARG